MVIFMEQKLPHNTETSVSRQLKIEECLLNNMNQVDYERISVADMCRQMGISRTLFYTYFPDKEACLHSLIDRMIRDSMLTLMKAPHTSLTQEELITHYLNYWKQNAAFLDAIRRQNMKGSLIDRCFLLLQSSGDKFRDVLSTPDVRADDSILWLYAAVRFTILMQWHEHNFTVPVEEMAVKYLRMLEKPIIQETNLPF